MRHLTNIGRIIYGLAVAETGLQTIYYKDFPYWLVPYKHSWIPGLVPIAYIFGALLILAGASIVLEKKIRTISLLLGAVLLSIFFFWFIPYQFMTPARYMHLLQWENAEKELAFAAGAFVIVGGRYLRLGTIFFSITMISFGILHFLYAKDVADYVPAWAPNHLFWTYFAGSALIGSGIAIILKIKVRLIAALLGVMLLSWFISLHILRVINSPAAYLGSEVTSAFLAFAYSGIAFVIAGTAKKS